MPGMDGWDIFHSRARSVLGSVLEQNAKFSSHGESLSDTISGVSSQCGSGQISQVLDLFAEAKGNHLQSISDHISRAHGGASSALDAYAQGDQTMADNATYNSTGPGGASS